MIRFQTKSNINKIMSRELVSLIDLIGYCAVTYLVNKYDIMIMADALAAQDRVALNYDFPITNLMMNKMIEELNLVALAAVHHRMLLLLVCRLNRTAAIAPSSMHRYDSMSPITIRCTVCSVE